VKYKVAQQNSVDAWYRHGKDAPRLLRTGRGVTDEGTVDMADRNAPLWASLKDAVHVRNREGTGAVVSALRSVGVSAEQIYDQLSEFVFAELDARDKDDGSDDE
jgi:hypothetical protein